jgi:hypothetical protein
MAVREAQCFPSRSRVRHPHHYRLPAAARRHVADPRYSSAHAPASAFSIPVVLSHSPPSLGLPTRSCRFRRTTCMGRTNADDGAEQSPFVSVARLLAPQRCFASRARCGVWPACSHVTGGAFPAALNADSASRSPSAAIFFCTYYCTSFQNSGNQSVTSVHCLSPVESSAPNL